MGIPSPFMSRPSHSSGGPTAFDRALTDLAAGRPVLVYDGDNREGEADILYSAAAVTSADISCLRNNGGGLVFVALSYGIAEVFELPYLHEVLDHPTAVFDSVGYDERPSFSFSVNHRSTYTGITDEDRALTVRTLGEAAARPETFDFAETFRAPGHVHLLRGATEGLHDRQGHTELALALAEAAGCAPAIAGCEMLDDAGGALSTADAHTYADRNDLELLRSTDIINQFEAQRAKKV